METPSSINPHASAGSGKMAQAIFHIARKAAWQAALESGLYLGDTLDSEGFIHCSQKHQVAGAANRFFRDVPDLVLLQIDPMRLESRLVYEALTPGEKFPHIYGPLQVDAVVGVTSFEPGPDGLFQGPV